MHGALQEFRLPNEEQLLDALYAEFGEEEFAILLPSISQASRARGSSEVRQRFVRGSSEVRQRLLAAEFRLVVVFSCPTRPMRPALSCPTRPMPPFRKH